LGARTPRVSSRPRFQRPVPPSMIENRAIRKTHLETGRVPPKAQDLILRRTKGAAQPPKFQFEAESVADGKYLRLSIALIIGKHGKRKMHYTMLEDSSVMDR